MNIKYVAYVDFDDRSGEFDQGLIGRLNVDKLKGNNAGMYQEWVDGLISTEKNDPPVMISGPVEIIFGVHQKKITGYMLANKSIGGVDFKLTEIFNTEKEAIKNFCEKTLKKRKSFFDGLFKK